MNQGKEEIQNEAIAAWLPDKNGTVVVPTGVGKTWIALKALKHTYLGEGRKLKVLHLAEETGRKDTFEEERTKFKKIFGFDKRRVSITYACYQSAYKWENTYWTFVIYDEIHSGITREYSKFMQNNAWKNSIGLTATPDLSSWVDEEKGIKKRDLLAKYCPICYVCTPQRARKENALPQLRFFAVLHELDLRNKTIPAGSKKKPFKQSEKASYEYWTNRLSNAINMPEGPQRAALLNIAMSKRSNLLYALPSKVKVASQILGHLEGKTIVFANSLDLLEELEVPTVSSRHKDEVNRDLLEQFNSDKIPHIGSFKKLQQGVNLSDLSNVLMISYHSKGLSFVQKSGRIRSKEKDFVGDVVVIVTQGTVEMKWFRKMTGEQEVIYCNGFDDFKNKYL